MNKKYSWYTVKFEVKSKYQPTQREIYVSALNEDHAKYVTYQEHGSFTIKKINKVMVEVPSDKHIDIISAERTSDEVCKQFGLA